MVHLSIWMGMGGEPGCAGVQQAPPGGGMWGPGAPGIEVHGTRWGWGTAGGGMGQASWGGGECTHRGCTILGVHGAPPEVQGQGVPWAGHWGAKEGAPSAAWDGVQGEAPTGMRSHGGAGAVGTTGGGQQGPRGARGTQGCRDGVHRDVPTGDAQSRGYTRLPRGCRDNEYHGGEHRAAKEGGARGARHGGAQSRGCKRHRGGAGCRDGVHREEPTGMHNHGGANGTRGAGVQGRGA